MLLDRAHVEHIALLARLELTEEEIALFQRQLSSILGHVAVLQELDTRQIPPTAQVIPRQTVLREDESRPSLAPDLALANAPETEENLFKVPPVFEEFPVTP